MAGFDGTNWDIYNYTNSALRSDDITAISVDSYGNKWISNSSGGLYAFREGGIILTDTEEKHTAMIDTYSLKQNYPNPFNPTTTISYSIPNESHVVLKVYDLLGREMSTLVNKEQSTGEYKVNFDGTSLPSGIYIYTIHAGQYRASKKLMLLK
jgi:hypothetical protein